MRTLSRSPGDDRGEMTTAADDLAGEEAFEACLAGRAVPEGAAGLAGFAGDEAGLRAWVFTIAHRRLLDDWRRRSRRPQLADDPGDLTTSVGGNVEDDVLVRIGAEDVERLCGTLPADQRSVLLLRILADLTVEQVAQVMDRSVASVKALQRRGLRALRDRVEAPSEKSSPVRAPLPVPVAMSGAR